MQKTQSGRHEPATKTVRLSRWQDVSMCNIPVITSYKVYVTLMGNVVHHECSVILTFPSPQIVTYATRNSSGGDAPLKERLERVLGKGVVEIVLEYFAYASKYVISDSRQGDLHITQWQRYGVLNPFSNATIDIISSSYVTEAL